MKVETVLQLVRERVKNDLGHSATMPQGTSGLGHVQAYKPDHKIRKKKKNNYSLKI